MGKLRHGIIGFGGIGREHARSAKVLDEYELCLLYTSDAADE